MNEKLSSVCLSVSLFLCFCFSLILCLSVFLSLSVCSASSTPFPFPNFHLVSGIVHGKDKGRHLPPYFLGPTIWTLFLVGQLPRSLGRLPKSYQDKGPWRNDFQEESQLSISRVKERHDIINTHDRKLWYNLRAKFSPKRGSPDPLRQIICTIWSSLWSKGDGIMKSYIPTVLKVILNKLRCYLLKELPRSERIRGFNSICKPLYLQKQ